MEEEVANQSLWNVLFVSCLHLHDFNTSICDIFPLTALINFVYTSLSHTQEYKYKNLFSKFIQNYLLNANKTTKKRRRMKTHS